MTPDQIGLTVLAAGLFLLCASLYFELRAARATVAAMRTAAAGQNAVIRNIEQSLTQCRYTLAVVTTEAEALQKLITSVTRKT